MENIYHHLAILDLSSPEESTFIGISQPALLYTSIPHPPPASPPAPHTHTHTGPCLILGSRRVSYLTCEFGNTVTGLFLFVFSLESSCHRENTLCSSEQYTDRAASMGKAGFVLPVIRWVQDQYTHLPIHLKHALQISI